MKKLFLFTLICSLGFFTACSDDDDNDTPTPTPPEVNLAKEIEGLYNADLFLTYGEFYQFNLSSCIRQQNSLTAHFVSFSLSNLANIFYPPNFYNN